MSMHLLLLTAQTRLELVAEGDERLHVTTCPADHDADRQGGHRGSDGSLSAFSINVLQGGF